MQRFLVAVGTDEAGVSSTRVKVWQFDKLKGPDAQAVQPSRVLVPFGKHTPEAEVTAFDVCEFGGNQVGYEKKYYIFIATMTCKL